MKFVILLAACVALAAAASRQSDEETGESRASRQTQETETQETQSQEQQRRRLVSRKKSSEKRSRRPDDIVLLNGVQQCVLCRETWFEALNSFSAFANTDHNADGVITEDKTCRFACRGEAMKKIKRMNTQEKNELLCESCRIGIDFWRAQPSKKTHYQLSKDRMCKGFTTQATREDCEHTVRMYGFDIFAAIRNEVSSSSICHMYNLCGRQAAEFNWEEDAEEDEMEKDLESVSLDELIRARQPTSKETNTETEATNSAEEDGVPVSTERTSSEERERAIKQRRQHEREARRERRRQERKERHERERVEQARRHAEERRQAEEGSQSTEE